MSSAGNVLIVDDLPERAARLREALAGEGYAIEVRSEVADLEATLGPDSPWDCILCTVDLMNVSWASVRRAMRGFDVQVPVVTFTDERDVDSMATALGLGAADFFVRPAEKPGLLRRSIERSVTHRRLQRELRESKERLEAMNTKLRHSLRILEQDQQAGRQVQRAMLPAGALRYQGYWFSHKILPSLYLSGDFADYFRVGKSEVVFFLADVSGHGSSSAFATVLLKNLFARKRSAYLRHGDRSVTDPVAMLRAANGELRELAMSKYATMVVGVVDCAANTLRYSVAGHLPLPVIISTEGARYLEGSGSPVGLLPKPDYTEAVLALPECFILSVLSDGVLEVLPSVNLIDKERELLERVAGPPDRPSVLARRLGLGAIEGKTIPDDIAALFISRGLG